MEYNPWPSYNFTGKLRPFPPGPKRSVPPHIGRPDYADHPTGFPASENAAKGSGQIKVLDDEEIEGMRVACRLGREVLDEAAKYEHTFLMITIMLLYFLLFGGALLKRPMCNSGCIQIGLDFLVSFIV